MKVEEMMTGSTTIKIFDNYVDDDNKNELDKVIAELIINMKNENIVISEKEAYNSDERKL